MNPLANPVNGATVQVIIAGTVEESGTTDSNGYVEIPVDTPTRPLAATVRVLAICGYAQSDNPVTLNCQVGGLQVFFNVVADSSHVCCLSCPYPIPKTLYFTCANGAATLTSVSGSCVYEGWLEYSGQVSTAYTGQEFTCTCDNPSPWPTITYAKFTKTTGTVRVKIRATVSWASGSPQVAVVAEWAAAYGPTGCSTCDWAYVGPTGWMWYWTDCSFPPDPPGGGANHVSVASGVTCASCNDFHAEGELGSGCDFTYYFEDCSHETDPVPAECPISIPNPVGAWEIDS